MEIDDLFLVLEFWLSSPRCLRVYQMGSIPIHGTFFLRKLNLVKRALEEGEIVGSKPTWRTNLHDYLFRHAAQKRRLLSLPYESLYSGVQEYL